MIEPAALLTRSLAVDLGSHIKIHGSRIDPEMEFKCGIEIFLWPGFPPLLKIYYY